MKRTAGRLGLEALVVRPQKQRITPHQLVSVLSLNSLGHPQGLIQIVAVSVS
jgi:hypothetical protein